jgi:concanavalin A-like lectin/glucanase superfamily protein
MGLGSRRSSRHGWQFTRWLLGFALVVSGVGGPTEASAGVVGHWPMDEAGGQAVIDASGDGLDGVLGSSSEADEADPVRIPGRWGGALSFDGSNRVTIPDSTRLEPARISVEAWVRRSGSPGRWRYVVSKGATTCWASSYGLYSGPGGGLAFYAADDTDYVLSPAIPAERVWDGA